MIRNILFDMGGVLLEFTPEQYVARLGLNAADSAILLREVFHSVEWVCLDRDSLTEEEALASMCKRIPERLRAAAREVFETWDRPRTPYDNIYGLVEQSACTGSCV